MEDPWRVATGVVAVALAWLPAWTDAIWVLAPALLGALGLGAVAVAGGRRWVGLARVVPEGARTAVAAPRELAAPAVEAVGRARAERLRPALRTIAVTVVLVTLFAALLVGTLAACVVRLVAPRGGDGWRGANLARTRASATVRTLPPCVAHPVRSQP